MRVSRTIAIVLAIATTLIPITAHADEIKVEDIDPIYRLYAWEVENTYDVSSALILSLCYEESRFREDVVGGNLTQITNTKWFKEGIEAVQADAPKDNVYQNMMVCGYYIAKWAQEYDGEPYLYLEMWNEGYESALSNYDCQHPSAYARRIMNRAERWEQELEVINNRLHP